jgi:arylsulfatase A-like enzyme
MSLSRFALNLSAVTLLLVSPALRAADARPNILLAMADDWSWPHASCYGDPVVKTPTFDRLAADGYLGSHCFSVSPTCSASRASLLTGQTSHRLKEGANLHGILPAEFKTYPDMLEAAGYYVGFMGKGWGPGSLDGSGRSRNPAGPRYQSFEAFLASVPAGKPFCFWFGSHDPHRAYAKDSGRKAGLDPAAVKVPPFLPDVPEVRGDILDYYFAVQRFDRDLGGILQSLDKSGRAANTLVLVSGDNGWPFPRAKANLYDAGTRQPLGVRWPARIKPGQHGDALISFADFAPTFLEAAGLPVPADMTGRSFLPLLEGKPYQPSERVFVERERHANVRAGDAGYPARAMRTRQHLYIRNFRPDRWPAGDPQLIFAVGPFGDVDGGPSKDFILNHRDQPAVERFFRLAFAKRPAEELYDVTNDPHNLTNLADHSEFADVKKRLRADLDRWMADTGDPRATADDDRFDRYRYFGVGIKK